MARLIDDQIPFAGTASAAPASLRAVSCSPALLQLAASKRALLLQGPVGPFFDRLTRWLESQGTSVHRVIFQAGDRHDCCAGQPMDFGGDIGQWPEFLLNTVQRLGIDTIVLFGQARAHHAAAIALGKAAGLPVVVLEEGYVRPGYVTMELGGVNGFSTTLSQFAWQPDAPGLTVHTTKPLSSEHQFRQMAWFACRHYWAMYWGKKASLHYKHHKSSSIWHHSQYWVWSLIKKNLHLPQDNARVKRLIDQSYFFVPLQHDGDSQIIHHSPFEENTEFIIEVLRSFAHDAPLDALLVFRQHPHSRGGRGHGRLIRSLAAELGVGERVVHLVEGHTPTIVTHARGVVVINSTVGLQALMRHKPLMVLGDALYDRPGLSHQGLLHDFWADCPTPDAEQADAFLQSLIALTQAPCNVYGRADEPLLWTVAEQPAVTPRP